MIPEFLFDSHAHITNISNSDFRILHQKCLSKKVESIWNMSVSESDFDNNISLGLNSKGFVKTFLGIDPEVFIPGSDEFVGFRDISKKIKKWSQSISAKVGSKNNSIFGIGEVGLDMFWLRKNNVEENVFSLSKKSQEELFRSMLSLAQKFSLPISIHSRGAEREVFNIVNEYTINAPVIFHSFTGGAGIARDILSKGYYLGLNAIATYASGTEVKKMYSEVIGRKEINLPKDLYNLNILLETDSPYLPMKKGEVNTPDQILDLFNWCKCNLRI